MMHVLETVFRTLGANPLLAFLCAGGMPLLWSVERRTSVWLGVMAATVPIFCLHAFLGAPAAPYFAAQTLAAFGEAGCAAAAFLAFFALRRPDARIAFGIFATVLLANYITGKYLRFTGTAMPVTFDRVVAVGDATLGSQLSFAIGRLFGRVAAIRNLCFLTYNGLLFALLLLCSIRLRQDRGAALVLVGKFMAAGIAGSLLYAVLPVCGPAYAFPDAFPWHPLTLSLADAVPGFLPQAPRNGVPSLHFTWALLFFLGAADQPRMVRAVFGMFLVGTVLATMGTGEHYCLDLVIAVPFACAIASLNRECWRDLRLRFSSLLLLCCTVAWMLILRFDPGLLLVSWRMPLVAGATTVVPLLCWNLLRAPRSSRLVSAPSRWWSRPVLR